MRDLFEMYPLHTRLSVVDAGNCLTTVCHRAAVSSGWWSSERVTNPFAFSNALMLIVSELAEAMEGDRKSLMDDHLPQYSMRAVELADALIRIFDLAGAYHINLGNIILAKLEYNANRADHKPENRQKIGGKAY